MAQELVSLHLGHGFNAPPPQAEKEDSYLPARADFVRHLRALLTSMVSHAVEADVSSRNDFQKELTGIAGSLIESITRPELESAIARVLRAVEGYNQQASRAFKTQASEMRDLLDSLAKTVVFIASGTETSVKQLGLVESKLERAIKLQDARQMKEFMQESLSLVITESRRVESEAKAKTAALKTEVERLEGLLKSAKLIASDDPMTGLPARAAAEQALESISSTGKPFTTALFVIDRLVSINGKFGRLVGDQVLVNGALTIAQRLQGAMLFRWSGPTFLAIFDQSLSTNVAEVRARQAAGFRIEKEFQIGERNSLVVITCSFHLRQFSPNTTPDSIVSNLDDCLIDTQIAG